MRFSSFAAADLKISMYELAALEAAMKLVAVYLNWLIKNLTDPQAAETLASKMRMVHA